MNKLRKLRRRLRVSQHELARIAGIAPWKISFWETNRLSLSSDEICAVRSAIMKRAEQLSREANTLVGSLEEE